jgi:integrase
MTRQPSRQPELSLMRKSEILNTVWSDIDFDNMTLEISPKENTDYTWGKLKEN